MSYVYNLWKLYSTDGVLMWIYLISWVLVLVLEKNKDNKTAFCFSAWYLPLFILNPLVGMVLDRFDVLPERFVRIYWLLPVFLLIAYGLGMICQRIDERAGKKRIYPALVLVLFLIAAGVPVVSSENFVWAENVYKLPDGVIQISDMVEEGNLVAMPIELSTYARQYDGKLHLLYGRYPDVSADTETIQVYELMQSKTIEVNRILDLATQKGCKYVVLDRNKAWTEEPSEGFTLVGNYDNYCLYRINSL